MVNTVELYHNEWVSLNKIVDEEAGINGYVYSHETKYRGIMVAILPHRIANRRSQFLVKTEVTPCWSLNPVKSAITGGHGGKCQKEDVIKELLEQAGYKYAKNKLISLGTCYGTKSTDTVYHLYSADLTNILQGEALEDGTESVWMSMKDISTVKDPIVSTMLVRLMHSIWI